MSCAFLQWSSAISKKKFRFRSIFPISLNKNIIYMIRSNDHLEGKTFINIEKVQLQIILLDEIS